MIGVTLAELMQRYRGRLSETSTEFFDASQAIAFANEAQDIVCRDAPYTVVVTYGTTTVPYRAEYLLPEDIVHPTGAIVRRSGGQLVRCNFYEKDLMDGAKSWGAGTRVPTSYLDLYIEGHKRPTPLSADTDYTDIPAYVSNVIVDYMEAMAKTADEEPQQHQLAMARFQQSLMGLKMARLKAQYDQWERTRANRRISQGFGWPYWCTYRQTEEGISVELWGV